MVQNELLGIVKSKIECLKYFQISLSNSFATHR